MKKLTYILVVAFIAAALICPASAFAWSGLKQVSYYTGGTTASGKHITNSTHYVAVPISKVVKKTTWKKMSAKNKSRYFYYGEKLRLKRYSNGHTYYDTVTVQDCGGFGRCGQYYKGKWCPRLFDVTPAARRALHISKSQGVALVRYKRV